MASFTNLPDNACLSIFLNEDYLFSLSEDVIRMKTSWLFDAYIKHVQHSSSLLSLQINSLCQPSVVKNYDRNIPAVGLIPLTAESGPLPKLLRLWVNPTVAVICAIFGTTFVTDMQMFFNVTINWFSYSLVTANWIMSTRVLISFNKISWRRSVGIPIEAPVNHAVLQIE